MKKVLIVLLLFIVIVVVFKTSSIAISNDVTKWKFTEIVDKDIRYRIPRPEFKKLIE